MGLTALKVTKQLPPGKYGDGKGLWLQVSKWGTKAWLFRYQFGGKARSMGLGSVGDISLADAREMTLKSADRFEQGKILSSYERQLKRNRLLLQRLHDLQRSRAIRHGRAGSWLGECRA